MFRKASFLSFPTLKRESFLYVTIVYFQKPQMCGKKFILGCFIYRFLLSLSILAAEITDQCLLARNGIH